MPSTGGSRGGSGGDDTGHGTGGMGRSSEGGGIGSRSSQNLSDVTKAMLTSPTAQQYRDYYSSKLGVMGTPGAQWGDFTKSAGNIGSMALNGFLGLVDTPINFANRFGANLPTLATPPARMAPLKAHDPTPKEQMRGYTDFGKTPPADVVQSLRDQYAALNPQDWGFMDKVGVPAAAKFTQKALNSVMNPLAAVAMLSAGVPPEVFANPIGQKAPGFLTGGISQAMIDRAMFENTYDKIMGTGIYGGDPSYGLGAQDPYGGEYQEQRMAYTPTYQPSFVESAPYGGGYMSYGNYS